MTTDINILALIYTPGTIGDAVARIFASLTDCAQWSATMIATSPIGTEIQCVAVVAKAASI